MDTGKLWIELNWLNNGSRLDIFDILDLTMTH